MKKLFPLLFVVVLMTACDINDNPITLSTTASVVGSIPVSVPQTNGTSVSYTQTVTQDLNDAISDFPSVTEITINSLSYEYKNATGNSDAVIESATMVINGVTVATLSFVNIAQEASNGTVFNITDQAVLNQLETLFLNNSTVSIQFSGTAVSNDGPASFEIEMTIGLTVSLN